MKTKKADVAIKFDEDGKGFVIYARHQDGRICARNFAEPFKAAKLMEYVNGCDRWPGIMGEELARVQKVMEKAKAAGCFKPVEPKNPNV
jgi:hypothetical protein